VRILLIVNTTASAVTPRARVVIQKALAADHEVRVAETSRRGNATRLAQSAAAEEVGAVVVLGGDGTLNEAANGLVGTGCALGVLPGGSTNVFARTIGMASDPVEATGQLLAGLAHGRIRSISLGSVNGRYFLFHTGVGFDASVVAQVERRAGLKRWAGHPLFVYAAFATWFRHYDRSRPRFAVHLPDGEVVADGYLGIVFNTNPYTFLGRAPLNVAPDAGFDGPLVAVTFRTLALPTMLVLAASALRSGRLLRNHPLVDYRTELRTLRVIGHGPVPYQVDGEYLGEADELVFHHVPDALRLVLPGL